MPLVTFHCAEHGNFKKVVGNRVDTVPCPACGKRAKKAFSVPKSTAQVRESADRPPVMTDRQIESRVAQDAEVAWSHVEGERRARKEAEANLPDHVKAEAAQEREYREKLEQVIKSEPQENLDRAGVKIWRREEEHVSRLEEKYAASPEKRPTQ